MANRIGGGSVAGQQKSLAAAAAEIQLPPRTALAWFGHPVGAAKTLEHRGPKPDVFQRAGADVGKPNQGSHGPSGREGPRRQGRHRQEDSAPTVQTRLGIFLKVIGQDVKNLRAVGSGGGGRQAMLYFLHIRWRCFLPTAHCPLPTFLPAASAGNRRFRLLHLLPRRHERGPIAKRPAGVLRMGQFQAIDLPLAGKIDDVLKAIEIVPVQDDVERHRKLQPSGRLDRLAFALKERVPARKSFCAAEESSRLICK